VQAEAFQRLQRLFDEALKQPRAARDAWARDACGSDGELHEALSRLLAIEDSSADSVEEELVSQLSAASRALSESAWAPGSQVGRYRIVREIGRGGMGRVYAAVFVEGDVEGEVAIKVLHRDAWTEGLARRFLRERRLLAALRHPSIARFLDVGESPVGEPYLVMDLVSGEHITLHAQRIGLELSERLELFAQVLRAVSHAHRNLILHRDIKPSNVMVDDDGRVRLLDFGIAKMVGVEEDLTMLHGRMLTPTYAAPESLDGAAESGVASDVYSLGVLLHELLVGRPPFEREGRSASEFERCVREVSPQSLSRAITTNDASGGCLGIEDARAWAKGLTGDIDAIVQKALRKRPEDRYASVDAFEADIVAFLERRPVSARNGAWPYRFQRFISRHRYAVAAASVVLAVSLVAGGVFIQQAAEVRRERDRATAAVNLLRESFSAADPMRTASEPVPARGVLEGAGQRLLPLLKADPTTYFPVALDLADTQFSLGLLSETSAGWIEDAMATPIEDELLRHRRDLILASLAVAREDVPRAKRLVDRLRVALPEDARVTLLEARVAMLERREDDALSILQALWQSGATNDSDVVDVALSLAEMLRRRGRSSEALPILDQLLANQFSEGQAPSPEAVVTMIRLARVEVSLGLAPRAIERIRDAEPHVERYFGSRSTTYATLQATKAAALNVEEDYAEAAEAFRAAADAYAGSLGSSHRNVVRSRFNQAQTLSYAPGREEEAMQLYEIVEETARSTMTANDPLLAFLRVEWASALVRGRRWDEARGVLERVALAPGGDSSAMQGRLAPLVDAIVGESTGCVSELPPEAPAGERLLRTTCRR
jgi:serine/threonine-protein kinase